MNFNKYQIICLFFLVSCLIFLINFTMIKLIQSHFIKGQKNLIENTKNGKVNKYDYAYLSIKYIAWPLIMLFIWIIILEVYYDKGIVNYPKKKKEDEKNILLYHPIKNNDEEGEIEI